ncbi:sensor histidine kinase [Kutzneria albida]|uniref:histidine kinase n=1 Tax=Kutzneria albida DSM 43870 TaxID=1449976 RepID=W5WE84_9PSEU|nr:hypothetical protein [Kutzneria albida]AHH98906.1 hypothetical protein KALB_5544 [Kutzneria albida DSM 43870]
MVAVVLVGASTELPAELPGSIARAVYGMVCEYLVNTAKHAPGAEVTVTLYELAESVDVRVSNTAGEPTAPAPRSGFGLLGMRERVLLSGGSLSVGPTPAGGFAVSATYPKESR